MRGKAAHGGSMVFRVYLNSDVGAPQRLRCNEREAGACERVEHDALGIRECLHQRRERRYGLLGRVQFVAGVFPFDNVGNGTLRLAGISLSLASKSPDSCW
jgi:hypothetical protein